MSNVFVEETSLQDIADAIREKNGTETTYKPSEMGTAIRALESGGSMETGEITNTNQFTVPIPVTSKKTHIVMYPKVIGDETMNTERASYILAIDGGIRHDITPSKKVFSSAIDSNTVFGDTQITLKVIGTPINTGNYYWYVW